jgi:general secretion pathway protein G
MLNIRKNGFTMIELVLVIVVLGILAAVAVPKFAATRTDAEISKGRSDIASIRSAIISERQSRLIKGDHNFINRLDNDVDANTNDVVIFDSNESLSSTSPKILMYGITTKDASGHWLKTDDNKYQYKFGDNSVVFTYYQNDSGSGSDFHPAGSFDCNHTDPNCKKLTH